MDWIGWLAAIVVAIAVLGSIKDRWHLRQMKKRFSAEEWAEVERETDEALRVIPEDRQQRMESTLNTLALLAMVSVVLLVLILIRVSN